MATVRKLQHAQQARRADRKTAVDRITKAHGFAVFQEALGQRCCRRGLAAIIGLQLCSARIPGQHERTTTQPRRLRLYQGQHHLHRNRCIDGAAAACEQRCAGITGQRIGGNCHVALAANHGPWLHAGGYFGIGIGLRVARECIAGPRWQQEQQRKAQD